MPHARIRRILLAALAVTLSASTARSQAAVPQVRVARDTSGLRLEVDGRPYMINGVNWDYVPIGENYAYSLWTQPDAMIEAALAREMTLVRRMGANAIRVYAGIPPRWVKHIYERYGIMTVVNHPLGRYGTTIDGVYQPQTDYSDPRVRHALTAEVLALVEEFRGTPGLLFWLLGNENNYGLSWKSAETEALPVGERDAARARYLYSLVGEVARAVKAADPGHLVAYANGDLQYVDLIARDARGIDLLGANVYRGASFRDFFDVVKSKLDLPVVFTEFGADAWNEREGREDQEAQARYLIAQWGEIYEQSAGHGLAGNAIGGFTFQWSDGWWKFGQESRLDVHDLNASWPADAYPHDFVRGENNMNEEWWGIAAKGPPDARGLFELYPRAAYYGLQRIHALDPYAAGVDRAAIRAHVASIEPAALTMQARADLGAAPSETQSPIRVKGMRLELSTFTTGGSALRTPPASAPSVTDRPAFRGFDRMESYFVEFEAKPSERLQATLAVNVLGRVAENPIDEIFYENRGRVRPVVMPDGGTLPLDGIERLKVYKAQVNWEARDFRLEAFNRTGHYHWGYEGDFFGVYREANYGRNIDIYNAAAPLGVEITGKRRLDGLKVAFGPELWWGANPAALVKYRRTVGRVVVTGLFQEDLARIPVGATTSSLAIPLPPTRRASLHAATTLLGVGVEAGGIWAGSTRVGDTFQRAEGTPGNYQVLLDEIRPSDTFGAKAKLTVSRGRVNWYAQGAFMGLVADGGPTSVQTYTGWWLRDTGMSNQWNAMTGFTYTLGRLQIAPNVLVQQPLVGPMPRGVPAPGRLRNVLVDPFVVRANREMAAGELVLTWDPTPATWMYQWDNDVREDARFAASLAYTYKHLPTGMDASIGILADGRTPFAFPASTPARDLWEVRTRIIARVGSDLRVIVNAYGGTAEPNGDSQRLVSRAGGDLRLVSGPLKVVGAARFNDFGPYDYHRDFNLTFPAQYLADVAYVLGKPQWFDLPETKFGVRGTWRSLDRYSPRYCPTLTTNGAGDSVCDPGAPGFPLGREWEIRSYVTVAW
ncbi:MAG: hypothetical protein RL139_357 [Gemmatimonadota bacterium]|jgi:beta-galactosidase